MRITAREFQEISGLLHAGGRHSRYQPLPDFLTELLPPQEETPKWRSPRPQLALVRELISSFRGTPVVELGANTGFVSLSLAMEDPSREVVAIEAFSPHAEFCRRVRSMYGLENFEVINQAMTPAEIAGRFHDCVLLDFNVAHHVGWDVLNQEVKDPSVWWEYLTKWLSASDCFAAHLIQVGFNWGGRKDMPLHSPGDPSGFAREVVSRIPEGLTHSLWAASAIDDQVVFTRSTVESVNSDIDRAYTTLNLVGEFYRRPVVCIEGIPF